MYAQSLLQLASKVSQHNFFQETVESETKERTNSCKEDLISQFEPLDVGEDKIRLKEAAQTNLSKSEENSPKSADNSPKTPTQK